MLTPRDIKKLRCVDGLHYSFQLLKLSYEPMWELCTRIPSDNAKVAAALLSCWGFIDSLHRIREIAQAIPGLNVKRQEMRAFFSSTELAEEYRHYIQHVRRELSNDPPNPFPVWGSLAWVDPVDPTVSHTALLGAHLPGTEFTGCIYDRTQGQWVSNVCLGVLDKSFNFDPMYVAALRFKDFVMPYLISGAPSEVAFHEKLPIMSASIRQLAIAGNEGVQTVIQRTEHSHRGIKFTINLGEMAPGEWRAQVLLREASEPVPVGFDVGPFRTSEDAAIAALARAHAEADKLADRQM